MSEVGNALVLNNVVDHDVVDTVEAVSRAFDGDHVTLDIKQAAVGHWSSR